MFMDRDRRLSAFHEAGHVVAGVVLGLPVEYATAQPVPATVAGRLAEGGVAVRECDPAARPLVLALAIRDGHSCNDGEGVHGVQDELAHETDDAVFHAAVYLRAGDIAEVEAGGGENCRDDNELLRTLIGEMARRETGLRDWTANLTVFNRLADLVESKTTALLETHWASVELVAAVLRDRDLCREDIDALSLPT